MRFSGGAISVGFVSDLAQRRTYDPKRRLEFLDDFDATTTGSSGYSSTKIVGNAE